MNDSFHVELVDTLRTLCDPRIGEFAPGDRFLTERQVAERFETTRPTANKAVASLVGQGVLEIRRGVGTFVTTGPPVADVRPAVSLADIAAASNRMLATKVLSFKTVRSSRVGEEVTTALALETNSPLIRVERLRIVDGYPIAYERLFLIKDRYPELSRSDAKSSLVGLTEGHYRTPFGGLDQTIRAEVADKDIATVLEVPRGSALLAITTTSFAEAGHKLWHGRVLMRGDSYELTGRIAGPSRSRPAVGRLLFDE